MLPVNIIRSKVFKPDGNIEHNPKQRAFSVLVTHLKQRGKLSLKECYVILGGIRRDRTGYAKLSKKDIRAFIKEWRDQGLIITKSGYVYLGDEA